MFGGLGNYGLGWIANGNKVYFTINRVYKDAAFQHALGQLMKDQDIDAIAAHWASNQNMDFTTVDQERRDYGHLAKETMDLLKSLGPNQTQNALRSRVA